MSENSIEVQEIEVIDKKVKSEIVTSITDLITDANNLVDNDTASIIDDSPLYNGLKSARARAYIDESACKAKEAKKGKEGFKELKKSGIFTFGRNRDNIEETQRVLGLLVEAMDSNIDASKVMFNQIQSIARYSKKLFAIGVMSIAANRIVVREIQKRLENASKEEISTLAREELESVIRQLKHQESLERALERIRNDVESLNTNIENLRHDNILLENKLKEDIKDLGADLRHEAQEREKQITERYLSAIEESKKQMTKLMDSVEFKMETKYNALKGEMVILQGGLTQLSKNIEQFKVENSNDIENHALRLGQLEKRTFFDTTFYKVLIGIFTLIALGVSILNII